MLEIRDLHVKFHNRDREAVAGVSFTIENGDILGLVGESGCGKSVTAMSVAGLLPRSRCDYSGEILLDGRELLHLPRRSLRKIQGREIGVVFQEPQSCMDPLMKIGPQVEEVLSIHQSLPRAERKRLALEALAAVELPDPQEIYGKYPHQLSGGMRQRVMIAMALACKPDILIADEPTTALDVTIQAQILRLMNDLQKENGTAIMFITHDLGVINEMADDVVVMYCGQVVEQAPARLIFTDCEKSHPYTEGLMYSIPRLNDERAKLDPIPGVVPHPLDLPQGCKFAPRCRYCTGKCIREEPELLQVAEGQLIRCFYPDKMERRSEKHGKNTVHGQREDH